MLYKSSYLITLSFVLVLIIVVACSVSNTHYDINGTWIGVYNDKDVSLVFRDDKTCTLKYFDCDGNKNQIFNGRNCVINSPGFT